MSRKEAMIKFVCEDAGGLMLTAKVGRKRVGIFSLGVEDAKSAKAQNVALRVLMGEIRKALW